jgi:hypothetical protein
MNALLGCVRYLDEKIKGTLLVVAANGRVAARDILSVYFSGDGNVLSDRKAEVVIGAGQRKAVAMDMCIN